MALPRDVFSFPLPAGPIADSVSMAPDRDVFWSPFTVGTNIYLLTIDSGTTENLIDASLVESLCLPTQRIASPYPIGWLDGHERQTITHRARLSFSINRYHDTVWFAVVNIATFHACLGRPWQYTRQVTHHGWVNVYTFLHCGMQVVLRPHAFIDRGDLDLLNGFAAVDLNSEEEDEFADYIALYQAPPINVFTPAQAWRLAAGLPLEEPPEVAQFDAPMEEAPLAAPIEVNAIATYEEDPEEDCYIRSPTPECPSIIEISSDEE